MDKNKEPTVFTGAFAFLLYLLTLVKILFMEAVSTSIFELLSGYIMSIVTLFFTFTHTLYLAVFMLLSYAVKDVVHTGLSKLWYGDRYYEGKRVSKHWAVMFIGTVVAMFFLFIPELGRVGTAEVDIPGLTTTMLAFKLFISFTIGTTFHDLIIYQVIKLVKKLKLKNDDK